MSELHLLLGEIKGKLDLVIESQDRHETKLDMVSNRLNAVESKAASYGLVTGGIAAVGVALIKQKLGV